MLFSLSVFPHTSLLVVNQVLQAIAFFAGGIMSEATCLQVCTNQPSCLPNKIYTLLGFGSTLLLTHVFVVEAPLCHGHPFLHIVALCANFLIHRGHATFGN